MQKIHFIMNIWSPTTPILFIVNTRQRFHSAQDMHLYIWKPLIMNTARTRILGRVLTWHEIGSALIMTHACKVYSNLKGTFMNCQTSPTSRHFFSHAKKNNRLTWIVWYGAWELMLLCCGWLHIHNGAEFWGKDKTNAPDGESALLASKARKVQHNVKRKAIYVNEKTSQRRELCSQFKCH